MLNGHIIFYMIPEWQKLHLQRLADLKRGKSNRWGHHTETTKQKMRVAKLGEKNPLWKGDRVGLVALHEWVINKFPKPKLCNDCKKDKPRDLANISQKYLRDLSDWEWLCRRCHMLKDGRIAGLKQRGAARKKRHEVLCRGCGKKFFQRWVNSKYCNQSCYVKTDAGRYRRC